MALAFAGLIAYDVSFVYGSDVMMTVAQGFDAPMKILIPIKVITYSEAIESEGVL